ncbi:MAG TPA: M28 family peptidase, partial [Longimicrobiales bacterium]
MHMRIFGRAAALTLFLPLVACGGRGDMELPGPTTTPLADAAATITAADMIDRIGVLAHDSMRGRDTPSPGLESAARYIVREFRRMGLEGGAENGEFIQRYPFPLIGLDTANASLAFSGVANAPTLAYGTDYLLLAGRSPSIDAPLVFMGTAEAFAQSNPADGSLSGRLPVVVIGDAFDRAAQVAMSQASTAADNAGAESIVFVTGPQFPDAMFGQLRGFSGRPRRMLGGPTDMSSVLLKYAAAQRLFAAAGVNIASATAPAPLGSLRVALRAPVTRYADDTAPNVIAILRGSDPELADEYVVFSAHMDHVGVGRPDASGDSIYNGADDDASG